ncbi:MAG: hypothetical protein ACI4RM_07800 [Ruminococcus sp.]
MLSKKMQERIVKETGFSMDEIKNMTFPIETVKIQKNHNIHLGFSKERNPQRIRSGNSSISRRIKTMNEVNRGLKKI